MHYCSSVSFALYILINKIKQYFWLLFQYFLLKEYTVQLLSLYLVLRVQNCLSKAHSWLPRPTSCLYNNCNSLLSFYPSY